MTVVIAVAVVLNPARMLESPRLWGPLDTLLASGQKEVQRVLFRNPRVIFLDFLESGEHVWILA